MQTDHGDYNQGHRKRLQEKFTTAGIEALHEYEALELLLTYVIRRQDVKPQAKALLEKFGFPQRDSGRGERRSEDGSPASATVPRSSSGSSRKSPLSTSSKGR